LRVDVIVTPGALTRVTRGKTDRRKNKNWDGQNLFILQEEKESIQEVYRGSGKASPVTRRRERFGDKDSPWERGSERCRK